MADFFYWSKPSGGEGFAHLSVYLKNPNNGKPGWYFGMPSIYPVSYRDKHNIEYYKMPVKFGIHLSNAQPGDAAKPRKMGKPGDYLIEDSGGGLQIIPAHEFYINNFTKTSEIPGQKIAESSITILTGPTGAPTLQPSSPYMGGSSQGNY